MKNSRYIFIVLLPFLMAALLPWLKPDAVARVAVLSMFWAGVLNVFMAGFIVGDCAQHWLKPTLPESRVRLRFVAALGGVVLALMSAALHFVGSPMVSIAIMALALYFNSRLLRATAFGSHISELDYAFFQKIIWVALGCLLMLRLSYYRYFSAQ